MKILWRYCEGIVKVLWRYCGDIVHSRLFYSSNVSVVGENTFSWTVSSESCFISASCLTFLRWSSLSKSSNCLRYDKQMVNNSMSWNREFFNNLLINQHVNFVSFWISWILFFSIIMICAFSRFSISVCCFASWT